MICLYGSSELHQTTTASRSLRRSWGSTASIFPAATLPAESDTFTVTARAAVGEVERTLVAVVDRSKIEDPQVLLWRMQ